MRNKIVPHSLFTEYDVYLFKSGSHFRLYEKFGAHSIEVNGVSGVYFAVYAPAAREVQVIGNFNYWNGNFHKLYVRWDNSGIWEGFIPGMSLGELYKYRIFSNYDAKVREKSDPYGFFFEIEPKTSSISWELEFKWEDEDWLSAREKYDYYSSPVSIYEVHLGSWKKKANHDSLSYRELAHELVDYVEDMGFTHVEFLPITEHPFYPSWGYLSTGFFAPSSRYGTPQDFKYLVEQFHKKNIGVLLDWVPAHFPSDESFLADFDGSAVYEHPNPKKGFHPDWNSLIFNFERPEIQSFLISSAFLWMDKYHIDGLRVDAVASMLYLDYSREEGEWDPNEFGGNHNLSAIKFIKKLNKACYKEFKGITIIAEESTAFGGVSQPVHEGGLGFGFKWMMGWMNDTLRYMARDPIHRRYHHNEISLSMTYAYSESYVLPLSHDEVVHGKQSLLGKMPGDDWQRFANLRLLYCYMYSHPGHKLLFMGNEIGQISEWNTSDGVSWNLTEFESHKGIQLLIKDLNHLLTSDSAFHKWNFKPEGFSWIDYKDNDNCVLAYYRRDDTSAILVIANFTPSTLSEYRIGVPASGEWKEILNSDDRKYWGSGVSNSTRKTDDVPAHSHARSITLNVPPLGCVFLKFQNGSEQE